MGQDARRRADFRTGLVLTALALAMLAETATFPMTDSFGGVRNVWYVSPALFPLIVAGLLCVLSLVMTVNAALRLGIREAIAGLVPGTARLDERGLRFVLIVAAIVAFVFLLVPRVDFFLASTFFLLVMVDAFYVDDAGALRRNLGGLVLLSCAVLALTLGGAVTVEEGAVLRPLDLLVAAAIATMLVVGVLASRRDGEARRRFRIAALVALLAPALLCPAFRYGLLVPLPSEGLVIELMHRLVYA